MRLFVIFKKRFDRALRIVVCRLIVHGIKAVSIGP